MVNFYSYAAIWDLWYEDPIRQDLENICELFANGYRGKYQSNDDSVIAYNFNSPKNT